MARAALASEVPTIRALLVDFKPVFFKFPIAASAVCFAWLLLGLIFLLLGLLLLHVIQHAVDFALFLVY